MHEREVRVIYWSRENLHVATPYEEDEPRDDHSILIPWDIENAIDHVVVSPFAPHWYPEAVSATLHSFCPNLEHRLVASELGEEPIF